jgi:hypothetical protein
MYLFNLCRVPLARAVAGQTAETQGPTAISDARGTYSRTALSIDSRIPTSISFHIVSLIHFKLAHLKEVFRDEAR